MNPKRVPDPPRRLDRPIRFFRARFSPEGYLGLHLTIGIIVTLAAGWWFGDIAEDMSSNPAARLLDDSITAWFQLHATPLRTTISRVASFFGSALFLTLGTITIVVVLARRAWRYRLLATLLIMGGGSQLNLVLKHFFHRPRPVLENPLVTLSSFGFPSGHTMGATVFYGLLALLFAHSFASWTARVLAIWAAALAIGLIGASRIYLGAHYFTDVIGAIAIGLAWLAFGWTGVETLRRWRGGPDEPEHQDASNWLL